MDQITDDKLAWALWQAVEHVNLGQFVYGENFDEFHPDAPQWVHLRNFMTPEAAESAETGLRRLFEQGRAADLAWTEDSVLSELKVESRRDSQFGGIVLLICLEGTVRDSGEPDRVANRTSVLEFQFQSEDLAVPIFRANGVRKVISTTQRMACGLST